jgi:hypothetical protein
MAEYRISGVWKDSDGTITHYALHTRNAERNTLTRAAKTTKADAIALLEIKGSSAKTWLWDYVNCNWKVGETVEVVGNGANKYLRTKPDSRLTDNLGHLIDYKFILP